MNFLSSTLSSSSPWLPIQGSTFAEGIDFLFNAILWISLASFIPIVLTMVLFCIWYRRRPGYVPLPSPSHSTSLELIWTIVPSIFLVWIFVYGVYGYFELKNPPGDAVIIDVTAKQFNWIFKYPNGDITNELHLSVNQPVILRMKSEDVIHSFFVPAFRTKMDIMPGRYHRMWFQPNRAGDYKLKCAEYCGNDHSTMKAKVFVHTEAWDEMLRKFTRWESSKYTRFSNGLRLYNLHCSGCHSIEDKVMTGPSFVGFVDREHKFTNADPLKFDGPESDQLREYVLESLENPADKIVAGHTNQMTSFRGKLSHEEQDLLIDFIIAASKGDVATEYETLEDAAKKAAAAKE